MHNEKILGKKLTEAHANLGKIFLRLTIRIVLAGGIILAGVRGNPPKGNDVSFLSGLLVVLIILAAAAWVFFPLIHCKKYIDFYENGIDYCQQKWTLDEIGKVSFMEAKSNYSLFAHTYMCTEIKKFDVTYLKDAKKNFNRAYFDSI